MGKTLIIMRGVSGSGKSTFLKNKHPTAFRCSADDYFRKADGRFVYDAKRIQIAHEYSQNACLSAMKNSLPLIAVDNCNFKIWHFQDYLAMAKAYAYQVEIIRLEVSPELAAQRNIHDNNLEYINGTRAIMEDFPDEIIILNN